MLNRVVEVGLGEGTFEPRCEAGGGASLGLPGGGGEHSRLRGEPVRSAEGSRQQAVGENTNLLVTWFLC